jgi:hypothetical protein
MNRGLVNHKHEDIQALIREAQAHVVRQRMLVAELDSSGQETRLALDILRTYEWVLRSQQRLLDRIEQSESLENQ